MSEFILEGKIWVLAGKDSILIDDIDTDQIYHNAYLHITELEEMGQYALGNLEGYEDFSEKAGKGDIIIAGGNFGAGSSRQQAVDCFIALEIAAIVAESFGAIYKRNAINSGFPILTMDDIGNIVKNKGIETKDNVKLDLERGIIENLDKSMKFKTDVFSEVQKQIYKAGNLFNVNK